MNQLPPIKSFIQLGLLVMALGVVSSNVIGQNLTPIDRKATKKTKALYANLGQLAQKGILFGHQDDLAYGVGWKDQPGKSDVKDVGGSYPAVYGWDISKIGQRPYNIDTVDFEKMKGWIREGYDRGSVITISWHMDNFATGGDSWDTDGRPVGKIIPGGSLHADYVAKLDLFVDFLKDLKGVPIIFRPFHEHTGSWFWWGENHCTIADYKRLWHFTVRYLRDTRKIHNLLYAYSTDVFDSADDYLERYPGDDYVDILAFDDYHSIKSADESKLLSQRLQILGSIALERGKIAALSETGLESIPITNWWTDILLPPFKAEKSGRFSYVMVWRNSNLPNHFYGPHPGHKSAENFRAFRQDSFTIFEADLPNMYSKPKSRK